MDTRITPFGNHPDGGKIKEFSPNEEMPDYMLPLSFVAREILEAIPIPDRVTYVMNSVEPELWEAREFLKKRLRDIHQTESNILADRMGKPRRKVPSFKEIEETYKKACEDNAEPDCILIDASDPDKAQETIDFLNSL